MALAEDNNMLEELASAAADPAFGHGILPWTTINRSGGLGAHGLDESHHGGTEDRVPIEDEMPGRGVERERLTQLLDHLGRRGIGRDVEVHTTSSAMLDDEQQPLLEALPAAGVVREPLPESLTGSKRPPPAV